MYISRNKQLKILKRTLVNAIAEIGQVFFSIDVLYYFIICRL